MPDVRVGSVVGKSNTLSLLPSEWLFQTISPFAGVSCVYRILPMSRFKRYFTDFNRLYINTAGRWVGKDMPALRTEPYMNSLSNYLTKVEIELSNITIPILQVFHLFMGCG